MARLSLAEVGLLLLLVLALVLSAEAREKRPKTLRRKKREWILPPAKLEENVDYTQRNFIAKIRSDRDTVKKVEYYLRGKGADQPPYNLFVVDHDTGFVRITDRVDREKYPSFNLTGVAKFKDGAMAEIDIPLVVTIVDQNDNAPYFELHSGSITEASKKGTFVMQIQGKDNDQAGTINSEIMYSIISQEPKGTGEMFTIDEKTGKVYVKEPTLDREIHDSYKLIVQGTDMGGAANGLTGTGTVMVKVLDINDNIPTLEQSEYTGSVDENVEDVIVMKIKAVDKDLEHTDNWLTVFTIAKGNEDNLFSIETDKETNEGILKLIKPVDFEELQSLELGLLIENVAPFVEGEAILMNVDVQVGEGAGAGAGVEAGAGAGASGATGASAGVGVDVGLDAGVDVNVDVGLDADLEGGVDAGLKPDTGAGPGVGIGVGVGLKPGVKPGPGTKPDAPKSYPIKITVNNLPEGPAFIPDTKNVPVSEDPNEQPEDGVITVFAAVDPDTGELADDVSYAKAYDPDNWFTIDEKTAEIKLNKQPDRESPFLVNGTYIAKILAITKDMPFKTATGTIAIQVTDSNDHCPILTTTHSNLCSDKKTVFVTGHDEDFSPNAAPFTFTIIPDGTRGSWDIEVINETSAALHSREKLWPGLYELQVKVMDAQGLSCPADEVFSVAVCTCVETEDCSPRTDRLGTTKSELSAPAIGLLILAMCLLLFIPLLLLLCQCGGVDKIFPDQFSDLPFDAKEHLISYHTEGKGEDKEVPLQSVPIMLGTKEKVEMAAAPNFNSVPSKITENHQMTTIYGESVQKFQQISQSLMDFDNAYRFSRESFNHGNSSGAFSRQTLGVQRTTAIYEDIALPDAFLHDYYSQKAGCVVPVKDGLLEYDFEGQGSFAGSLGCCSLLESDNDLQFLSDLGPKFKTLAEICSPPIPTPKPSLTRQVEVEPVVKPKIEQSVQTTHTDIKTEKVTSSTNISKSSVATVSTALPSMALPHSKVTNISHSSNISHSATLPQQAQTVVLQHQPVFYTTSPVLQPMTYVVQPQLQNTVLLADGTHGAKFPGLYVVSGPQGSSSGLVKQSIELPISLASPTSPVSPTLLLPVSPGVSHGSVPVDGWKMIGQNTDGNYVLIKKKISTGEVEKVDPGSSQGTLPRGDILVKEAAPPQGVLGPAAHNSVFGILPGHTVAKKGSVVTLNRNLGQTWVGQPGQMGLGPVTVLGVGVGQSRMGTGHVVAIKPEVSQGGIWPAGISPVGISQVSVNQFEGIPALEQAVDVSGIPQARRIDSPKGDKTINVVNTVIAAETTKTHLPSKEEVMMKNLFNDDSDPSQNMYDDTVEETLSEDVITYTSEQHTTLDNEDQSEMVLSAFEEDEGIQEFPTQKSEKSSIVNFEEDIMKSLPGPDVLQTSSEQSDSVIEKPGDTMDETVPDQLIKITEAPKNKLTDVISVVEGPDERSSEFDSVTEDQSGRKLDEDVSPAKKVVSDLKTNQVIAISDSILAEENIEEMTTVTNNAHKEVKAEQEKLLDSEVGLNTVGDELSATPPNEVSTDIVNESEEKSIPDQETIPELVHSEGDKIDECHAKTDIADVGSSLQTASTTFENQEEGDLGDLNLISASEEIRQVQVDGSNGPTISTLELDLHTAKDSGHKEDDDQKNIMSGSRVDKDPVSSDGESTTEGEKEEIIVEEGVSLHSFSTDDQVEDTERQDALSISSQMEINVISHDSVTDEEKDEAAVEETVSPVQQNIGSSDDQDQGNEEDPSCMSSQVYDTLISDNEEEIVEVVALSVQQNVSVTDDQDDESSGRGPPLENELIPEDNIRDGAKGENVVEEEVSPEQKTTSISDEDEDSETEDASQTVSQEEDMLISDDRVSDGEKEAPSIQQKIYISGDQDEGSEGEDASERGPPLEDEFIPEDNIRDGARGKNIVEEEMSPEQKMTSIADEDEDSETEDASQTVSQEEDMLISDESVSDGEKEEIIVEEGVSLHSFSTDDQDEDTERQDVLSISSQMEVNVISDDNITDEEKDEAAVEEMVSTVQQNIGFSDDEEEENRGDPSCMSSQVDDTLISDNEEEIVEVAALSVQQNVSITDDQDDESSGRGPPLENELIPEDNIRDGAKGENVVEEKVSPEQKTTSISDEDEDSETEDASQTVSQEEDKLISDDSVSDGEKEAPSIQQKNYISGDQDEGSIGEDEQGTSPQSQDHLMCPDNIHDGGKEGIVASPLEQNISVPDDQDVVSAKEDTSDTSSHAGEEGIESYQTLEDDARYDETECLEMNQVVATTKVNEMSSEMSSEVTTYQGIKGVDSSQKGDTTLDIPEKQDNVGQELVRGANLEGLDNVVTSSKEMTSSKVATGQVSMSSEDRGSSGSIMASGQLAEGGAPQCLPLEKGKAEVISDLEIREGLDNASGQVSPTYYSEIKVVDKTASSVSETNPSSAETGAASFIATSEVAEDAGYLVQNERVNMTREAAGIDQNTLGKAGSIEDVSKDPYDMHGAEASGGQVSPVELQTVISQTPRNKSRKGKKDSIKSPKSPSGKCKQQ